MDTNEVLTGGCQCGKVRYELAGKIHRLNVCHCTDCQRQSGSSFGLSLVVPTSTFRLTCGELKTFELTADSGRSKTCAFCPDCGVRIYNQTSAINSIKAGTLDDTSWLRPDAHYWTRSKQNWLSLDADIPVFDTHE